jgi:lipopolysaccharide transport system ATP-binding protein
MISDAVIAFVVRDRLGQTIFSDDTSYSPSAQEIAPERAFMGRFRFRLPYLANGVYAVEAFVFERRDDGDFALLTRHLEKQFLYIQSPHPSNGLANIAMRAVSLAVVKPHADDPRRRSGREPQLAAGEVR